MGAEHKDTVATGDARVDPAPAEPSITIDVTVDENHNRMLDTLSGLIQVKNLSGNNPDYQRASRQIIEDAIKRLLSASSGLHVRRFESGGYPSAIISTRPGNHPRLVLAAHVDVVPGGDNMFEMQRRDGKIYGRGVWDMKSALAAYLRFMEAHKDKLNALDLAIFLSSDEEDMGVHGFPIMLNEGIDPHYVFLPDGGTWTDFESGAKGKVGLDITMQGQAAHAARVDWEGRDPVMPMIRLLAELKHRFPSEPCQVDNHWHPSMNVGRLHTGIPQPVSETDVRLAFPEAAAANNVPAQVWARLDIRYPGEYDLEDLRAKWEGLQERYSDAKMEEFVHMPPYVVDMDRQEIASWTDLMREQHGIEMGQLGSQGTTDARFLKPGDNGKIGAMLVRPEGGGIHTDEEWVSEEGLEKFQRTLEAWALQIAKVA